MTDRDHAEKLAEALRIIARRGGCGLYLDSACSCCNECRWSRDEACEALAAYEASKAPRPALESIAAALREKAASEKPDTDVDWLRPCPDCGGSGRTFHRVGEFRRPLEEPCPRGCKGGES